MMAANAPLDTFDAGCGPGNAPGDTCAGVTPVAGLCGPAFAPQDLLDFVRAQSVRDAAHALGLSRGTVHELRKGYWPADPRKIMQAWSAYQGRAGVVGTSWFIRRVRPGGMVRHAGQYFTAHELAARTGHMLAVTRAADGSLLAQTLALPAQRLPLVPVGEAGGAA